MPAARRIDDRSLPAPSGSVPTQGLARVRAVHRHATRRGGRATPLVTALLGATLAACGGGGESDAGSETRAGHEQAQAVAAAGQLVVRAHGTMHAGVGPRMSVRLDGREIGRIEVRATTPKDHAFAVPADLRSAKVDVVFDNDAYSPDKGDRNLIVESISVLGRTTVPGPATASFDRGLGAAAFDGRDIIPGQGGMYWNGALRFATLLPLATVPSAPPPPPPPPAPPPIVFNAPVSAAPGDLVSLQGSDFGTAPEVWLDGPAPRRLAIVNRAGANGLTVRLPADAAGALMLRVVSGGSSSAAVAVNGARADHLDARELAPGGRFRLFGRNLLVPGATPRVTIQGTAATLDLAASDEHMLVGTVPAGLAPAAAATLTVGNGNGTPAATLDRATALVAHGSGDPFALGVGWAAGFGPIAARRVDAATDSRLGTRMRCDGAQDDTQALREATRLAASSGGAVVQLPAGLCRITGIVDLPSRVVLQGAGRDRTTLRYETIYPLWVLDRDFVGLRHLSLQNAGGVEEGPIFHRSTHVVLQGVRLATGTSRQLFLSDNRDIVVTDSVFEQSASIGHTGPYNFSGSTGLVFTGNLTRWVGGAPSFTQVHDAYVAGNRFTRVAGRPWSETGVVHSFVMDFARRLAIVGNRFDVEGGPVTDRDRNDGETMLTEGGGAYGNTENIGGVSAATADTLSDPAVRLDADPFRTSALPENYGLAIVAGRGAGQTRRIVGYDAATGTVRVDRPWQVRPDATSRWASFVWGLERSLIKGNELSQNPRGIWLYQTAIRDVDIIGNRIAEGGGIYLRAAQKLSDRRFDPIYNVQVRGNEIVNTTGLWLSHIGVMFCNMDAKAWGTALIGIDVRDNRIVANRPNLALTTEDYANFEGYMAMLRIEAPVPIEAQADPRILGTVFERNACVNCAVGFRLGTGANGTTLAANRLEPLAAAREADSSRLWTNEATARTSEAAIGTVVQP